MDSGRVNFDLASHINQAARDRIRKGIGSPLDVLLSHKGTVGKVAWVGGDPPEFVCSPQTTFYRSLDHSSLEPRFLYFYLQSPSFKAQLASRKGETDMADYVSLTEQRRLRISLPPISEQRAIAEVLGAVDDKIEANRKATLVAEDLVTAAFRYAMAQIGDRDVPLFDVVDFIFGEPFKSTEFNSAGLGRPLIRIRDLKTFSPQFWTTEARPRETIVEPGDIVVGMDAEFRPTLWRGMAGLLNQRVCMALPRDLGCRAFIRELLVEPLAEIESFKTGTTVTHLNKSDLEAVKVSVPESTAVARFDAVAEPLRETIVALHRENMRLSSLRSTLLPRLLCGEVRVRDPESLVGQAV